MKLGDFPIGALVRVRGDRSAYVVARLEDTILAELENTVALFSVDESRIYYDNAASYNYELWVDDNAH
jgi:hypothetical protein